MQNVNTLLVLANVVGNLALAAACLKTLEVGPTVGPKFSPAARLVLLLVVGLALFAAIESASWRTPQRPGGSLLVFVLGLFCCWRVFTPAWQGFLERLPLWHRPPPPPVRGRSNGS